MNLPQAIQKAVKENGVDILKDRRFVSLLSDFQAFGQLPYAANMLRQIYANGYGAKIHQLYQTKDKTETAAFLSELRNKLGFDVEMMSKVLFAFSLPVSRGPKPNPQPNPKNYPSPNRSDLEIVNFEGRKAYKDEYGGIYSYPNCEIFYKLDNPNVSIYSVRPGTKDIYKCAFYYKSQSDSYDLNSNLGVKKITLPDTITFIPDYCFDSCKRLLHINIPNSIIEIGQGAFKECWSLQQITIPNGVVSIGDRAFEYCRSLQQITIPNSVASIGNWAFRGCSTLQQLTIPNSVISIGWGAFSQCSSLTQMIIPNSVTSIGGEPFENCSSSLEISLPQSFATQKDKLFKSSSFRINYY